MIFKKYLLLIGIFLLSAVGCANTPQKVSDKNPSVFNESESQYITNAAAKETKANNYVEIEFEEGSAVLTDSAKASLQAVVREARNDGKIDEVIVLSWSDEEYPSKNLKQLPRGQRELARNRNLAVEQYIKSLRRVDIDSYNMAEQPNIISRWFNTTDNKLKNSLLAAGLPTTADSPVYASKASHSVVLIKIE